jgi:hypothetical protein
MASMDLRLKLYEIFSVSFSTVFHFTHIFSRRDLVLLGDETSIERRRSGTQLPSQQKTSGTPRSEVNLSLRLMKLLFAHI